MQALSAEWLRKSTGRAWFVRLLREGCASKKIAKGLSCWLGVFRGRRAGAQRAVPCWSRCVRQAFLCGWDPSAGKDYSHRKTWVRDRLKQLAAGMAIDILDYAVLDNHLHTVLRNRPDIAEHWSDDEVARRWWQLCPHRRHPDGSAADPYPLRNHGSARSRTIPACSTPRSGGALRCGCRRSGWGGAGSRASVAVPQRSRDRDRARPNSAWMIFLEIGRLPPKSLAVRAVRSPAF